MEFLGVEGRRSLALRIADVPSGKDNVTDAQEGKISSPKAHRLKPQAARERPGERVGFSPAWMKQAQPVM